MKELKDKNIKRGVIIKYNVRHTPAIAITNTTPTSTATLPQAPTSTHKV